MEIALLFSMFLIAFGLISLSSLVINPIISMFGIITIIVSIYISYNKMNDCSVQ